MNTPHTLTRSRFCNLCGEPLAGEYQVYHDLNIGGRGLAVCPTCESRARRCAVCERPMIAGGPEKLCPACRTLYPVCTTCSSPVSGTGYRRPGRSELYCQDCFAHRERCSVCGVPVAEVHATLYDGSPICDMCSSTSVNEPEEARRLFEKVIAIVRDHLHLNVHIRPDFVLAERPQLNALAEQAARPAIPGVDGGHLLGVYIKRGRRREILIERGLPKLLMTKVIAHEYGHVWQGENCPFLRDPLLIEGFCEWVSYKTLGVLGAVKEQQRLVEAPGFYGDGLRILLAAEQVGGTQHVVEQIRLPAAGNLVPFIK